MNKIAVVSLLLLAGANAQASMIAYWQFPTTVPATADNFRINWPVTADQSTGVARLTTNGAVWDGSATPANAVAQGNFQYFTGDITNRPDISIAAGSALTVRGNTGLIANGTFLQFQFDTTSATDIVMSWAERSTTTGAATLGVSTSTDGVTFTPQPTLDITVTRDGVFRLRTLDLSAVDSIENSATAFVRLTFGGFSGTTGTYRFDNIQVNSVPTPAGLAALGLGGLLATRRRR